MGLVNIKSIFTISRGEKDRGRWGNENIAVGGHRKIGRQKLRWSDDNMTSGEMSTKRRNTRSENMENENLMRRS